MHRRVADINPHRAATVRALNRGKSLTSLFQRRFPGDGLPPFTVPALRLEDPVGVSLNIDNCRGFGADVAATEGVVSIAPHIPHGCPFHPNGQTANRLTEHAGVQAHASLRGDSHRRSPHERKISLLSECGGAAIQNWTPSREPRRSLTEAHRVDEQELPAS